MNKLKLIVPADFLKALNRDKKAEERFASLSPSHKREYIEWITEAKKVETRARRIEKALGMLKDSQKSA